jgi:hypothetical protein
MPSAVGVPGASAFVGSDSRVVTGGCRGHLAGTVSETRPKFTAFGAMSSDPAPSLQRPLRENARAPGNSHHRQAATRNWTREEEVDAR